MFRIVRRQLLRTIISSRFLLAVIIGSILYIYNAVNLSIFSDYLSEPINLMEVWCYCSSTGDSMTLSFFALLFLFLNQPFSEENEYFELIRISKLKWMATKLVYILVTIIIYYFILFTLGNAIVFNNAFIANIWSNPIYMLSFGTYELRMQSKLLISLRNIISCFSPITASVISFCLTVMYSFFMILLNMLLNMKIKNSVGIIVAIHAFGYAFGFYTQRFIKFSLFIHSILNNHYFTKLYSASHYPLLPISLFIFFILITVVIISLFISKDKFNFDSIFGDT